MHRSNLIRGKKAPEAQADLYTRRSLSEKSGLICPTGTSRNFLSSPHTKNISVLPNRKSL